MSHIAAAITPATVAERAVLSVQDIQALAKAHGLEFNAYYAEGHAKDLAPPLPNRITIWFRGECVPAWRELMTRLTEVNVQIYGTRTVTGSGATDDRLFDGYKAILPEVNEARAKIGLPRVFG